MRYLFARRLCRIAAFLPVVAIASCVFDVERVASADDHSHGHGHSHGATEGAAPVERPKIYLDKSPRIVAYQLKRLDNERLLLVERDTTDAKYAPVYAAILTRAGISPQHREESLAALVTINKSDAVAEVLAALESLDESDRQQQRTIKQLAAMMLQTESAVLASKADALTAATKSESGAVRAIGSAGLIVAGKSAEAWSAATKSQQATLDWLAAIPLVPRPGVRSALRDQVVGLLADSQPVAVRRAAINSLSAIPAEQADTFQRLAPFVANNSFRTAAIGTMLKIPSAKRDVQISQQLAKELVKFAEETPAEDRTSEAFLDAMQFVDQLLVRLPADAVRPLRARLREVAVRVVQIHTIEEEMRYDTKFFAVEAGRSVQVVLKNEDLMPHNLVITAPGKLIEIAQAGALLGPAPGFEGKPFVPKSSDVLFATDMVQPERSEALTFTAPTEPGEYPFVCTFPRHWMRMYGVMVVVEDLDAWQKNPTEPKDPIGNNRSFVQAWTIEDFKADLIDGLKGRSPEIGAKLFAEATCSQCHKVKGQGGAVGPELTDVLKRWKGDHAAVLREILDPSHRIDSKYAVQLIETTNGKIITGIIKAEDKESVSILSNPEAKEPTVVPRADIEEIVKTSKSMMPKALLDQYTKDEVFEILAYLSSLSQTE